MRRLTLLVCLFAAALPAGPLSKARASGGVLIPWSVSDQPDPALLALRSMEVHVTLDDLHAQVRIQQVFENRTAAPMEGKYVFPLGERARLMAFALWEGDQRMQGAVVEKMRGKRIYEELTTQQIDPGLLETSDEPEDQGIFSLRVSPIPAFGTSRIELVYEEELEVGSLGARLVVPLAPRRYDAQTAGRFSLTVDGVAPVPLAGVTLAPAAWFAGQTPAAGAKGFHLQYAGDKVLLDADLAIGLQLAAPAGGLGARLVAYRDASPKVRRGPLSAGTYVEDRGFFAARALFGGARMASAKPRDVVVLLDVSLSMQWGKLETALAAVEELLGERLGKDDRFGLVLFHDEVRPWKTTMVPATAENAAAALAFVRAAYLAGGTDLEGALGAATALLGDAPRTGADRDVVVLTDGHPTFGALDYRALGGAAAKALGDARLFVLGLGDDVNTTLLAALAEQGRGAFAVAPETGGGGDASYVVKTFLDKLARDTYRDVRLDLPAAAGVDLVYASSTGAFDGGDVLWFGRYKTPQPNGRATVHATSADGQARSFELAAALPEHDTTRPYVARGWAWRRVRDLVDRIRVDGERDEWVKEIIALARRYGFVTPYTSFIAAPRALLRPRNFQAGDPILRVKTGPEIKGVTVIFPFGLTKALAYVPDEDVWETRFLAPVTMTDGSYGCTLVLTDAAGKKLREEKRFTIDSQPPGLKVSLGHGAVRGGDRLLVTADADKDVRSIRARIDDGPAVDVRWQAAAKASVAELAVPAALTPGEHRVTVVAEDFARNTTITTVAFTVLRNDQ